MALHVWIHHTYVTSIIWSLIDILTIRTILNHGLSVVASTGNTVVLMTSILPLVLLMNLRLETIIDVVVWRLLDHTTAMRVPIRGRPLDEVLRQRSLLLILHLRRIVVRYLYRFIL